MADLLNIFGGYEKNSLIIILNDINNHNINSDFSDSFIDSVYLDREQIIPFFWKNKIHNFQF